MTRLRRAALTMLGAAAIAVSFAPGAASAAPGANDLEQQIDAKGKQLNGVIKRGAGLSDQPAAPPARARDVQARLAPLRPHLAAASTAVNDLVAQSYEGGNLGGLTALITAGSPESLI